MTVKVPPELNYEDALIKFENSGWEKRTVLSHLPFPWASSIRLPAIWPCMSWAKTINNIKANYRSTYIQDHRGISVAQWICRPAGQSTRANWLPPSNYTVVMLDTGCTCGRILERTHYLDGPGGSFSRMENSVVEFGHRAKQHTSGSLTRVTS